MRAAVFSAFFLLTLAGCNAHPAPPPAAQADPIVVAQLPAGAGCSSVIARFRAVAKSDADTGNANANVYKQIDSEIRKLVDDSHARATSIINTESEKLHLLANALLEYETLTGDDIKELLATGKLDRPEVELTFVHRAVGGITENDISLAATTNATIIGFNVRPDRKARDLADAEDVEIRTYEIIYKLLEDIEQAMVGMLAPEFVEVVTGDAEVREIFRVPKIGAIAGCFMRNGVITRGSKVRFLREGTIIWKGSITSLRRFKDDAREVREGFECGIGLSDFQDLKPGDIIETFEEQEVART